MAEEDGQDVFMTIFGQPDDVGDPNIKFLTDEPDSDDMGDEWKDPATLEEKRNIYKCKQYHTLSEIPFWNDFYFQQNRIFLHFTFSSFPTFSCNFPSQSRNK